MIQIFGTKKCRHTQRAIRFFKERGVETQFRDLALYPPSPGELDDMASALEGYEALLDTKNAAAKARGLSYMEYEPREELLRNSGLYKTPLVRPGKGKAAAGPDEKAWKEFCGQQ